MRLGITLSIFFLLTFGLPKLKRRVFAIVHGYRRVTCSREAGKVLEFFARKYLSELTSERLKEFWAQARSRELALIREEEVWHESLGIRIFGPGLRPRGVGWGKDWKGVDRYHDPHSP
ncbi:unnamed protein product [Discosporangium mesarthrocarpum]